MSNEAANNPVDYNERYSTIYHDSSVERLDNLTNTVIARWEKKPKKNNVPKYETKNGVTIDKLKALGHVVKIKHIRWATYDRIKTCLKNRVGSFVRIIPIPSTFRKDSHYHVLPKGGSTHITIKTKDDNYVCVSSDCSMDETFCYRRGITEALDRLDSLDLSLLGLL